MVHSLVSPPIIIAWCFNRHCGSSSSAQIRRDSHDRNTIIRPSDCMAMHTKSTVHVCTRVDVRLQWTFTNKRSSVHQGKSGLVRRPMYQPRRLLPFSYAVACYGRRVCEINGPKTRKNLHEESSNVRCRVGFRRRLHHSHVLPSVGLHYVSQMVHYRSGSSNNGRG